MNKKKLIRLTVGLIILSFIGFLINENFGSFIMFVSWIIIGISCYKYKKNLVFKQEFQYFFLLTDHKNGNCIRLMRFNPNALSLQYELQT